MAKFLDNLLPWKELKEMDLDSIDIIPRLSHFIVCLILLRLRRQQMNWTNQIKISFHRTQLLFSNQDLKVVTSVKRLKLGHLNTNYSWKTTMVLRVSVSGTILGYKIRGEAKHTDSTSRISWNQIVPTTRACVLLLTPLKMQRLWNLDGAEIVKISGISWQLSLKKLTKTSSATSLETTHNSVIKQFLLRQLTIQTSLLATMDMEITTPA